MPPEVQSALTYIGVILGLAANVILLIRARPQIQKDKADTYKSMTDALENSNEENDRLRKERNKYRKMLRAEGIDPDNGNGK